MAVELTAARHTLDDPGAAIEYCYDQGWTDGLPVVPPTEERVRAFLDVMGLAPEKVVGEIPARARTIRAEKVAINAVMAGCLPDYAPVVVAAVEALCAPEHNVNGSAASTGGSAPLLIVSGPIAQRIGMNGGVNLFGPGNRANATIGRAIRLLLMNAGGATPGVMDKSTIGHPGKYSYCIAEDDDARPWPPFHTQRGLRPETSAVTVFAGEAPHYVDNHHSNDPEGVLRSVAASMVASGRLRGGANWDARRGPGWAHWTGRIRRRLGRGAGRWAGRATAGCRRRRGHGSRRRPHAGRRAGRARAARVGC